MSAMSRVEFTVLADATIREHWACDVPREVIDEGIDAVHDYCWEQLSEGNCALYADDETVGNEDNREIEMSSLEDIYTEIETEQALLESRTRKISDGT